jgi:hypothetical protein
LSSLVITASREAGAVSSNKALSILVEDLGAESKITTAIAALTFSSRKDMTSQHGIDLQQLHDTSNAVMDKTTLGNFPNLTATVERVDGKPYHLDQGTLLSCWYNDFTVISSAPNPAQGQVVHSAGVDAFAGGDILRLPNPAWYSGKCWSLASMARYSALSATERAQCSLYTNLWFDWSHDTKVLPLHVLRAEPVSNGARAHLRHRLHGPINLHAVIRTAKGAAIWTFDGRVHIAPLRDLILRLINNDFDVRIRDHTLGSGTLSCTVPYEIFEVYQIPGGDDLEHCIQRELFTMWEDIDLTTLWVDEVRALRSLAMKRHAWRGDRHLPPITLFRWKTHIEVLDDPFPGLEDEHSRETEDADDAADGETGVDDDEDMVYEDRSDSSSSEGEHEIAVHVISDVANHEN